MQEESRKIDHISHDIGENGSAFRNKLRIFLHVEPIDGLRMPVSKLRESIPIATLRDRDYRDS